MRCKSTVGRLLISFSFVTRIVTEGADLYVAPNGTSSGPGTLGQPYNLSTALSGSVGQPGILSGSVAEPTPSTTSLHKSTAWRESRSPFDESPGRTRALMALSQFGTAAVM